MFKSASLLQITLEDIYYGCALTHLSFLRAAFTPWSLLQTLGIMRIWIEDVVLYAMFLECIVEHSVLLVFAARSATIDTSACS